MFDELEDLIEQPKRPAASYEAGFVETCKKCGGTGVYRSASSGRVFGPCYACKSKGKKSFKTSAVQRENARANAAARKEKAAEENWTAFAAANPAIAAWIEANKGKPEFAFPGAMHEAVLKYGDLTEKQKAACERCVAKREAAIASSQQRIASAEAIDTGKIEAAFSKASAVLKKPVLRFAGFAISLASAASKNAGALYVKNGEAYLGKIQAGKFFRSRECAAEQEAAFRKAAADPQAAAIEYGRVTGNCACCGRRLTDPASVARGIGPICAGNFGW